MYRVHFSIVLIVLHLPVCNVKPAFYHVFFVVETRAAVGQIVATEKNLFVVDAKKVPFTSCKLLDICFLQFCFLGMKSRNNFQFVSF